MAVRLIDGNALHTVISEWPESIMYKDWVQSAIATAPTLPQPSNEALTPYIDDNILACPQCGSGEYLNNEDGAENNYCGQCGQRIDWSRPPEGEEQ